MKTLNAKRITAIAAGAALLGLGLAAAGPITFQNVPIITASGQPVIQVVVGGTAQPSDGVAAANIAAAIGNLAYTSVPVTASVNATQAASVLGVQLGAGAKYTLSNQQVWLNETGSVTSAGSYSFAAYIGSVLNRAVQLNVPDNTKYLQGSSQYSYPNPTSGNVSTTASPQNSPYTGTSVPQNSTPTATNNGGGVNFNTFSTSNNDNIYQIGPTQLPGLLSSAGGASETEYLWVTGFPVFDQAIGSSGNFALLSAGGAYQVVFGKPIQTLSGSGTFNQASFQLIGQNWTILNTSTGSLAMSGQTTAVSGGSMYLAASLSPLTTVYVGQNITSGAFTVALNDLGQPNSNGITPASVAVYYQGALTNTSSIYPGTTAKFNVTGHNLYVKVNQTFAGLYAYQKWAKIQLYSNVYKVTSGAVFNQTYNKGWTAVLWWTNTTKASGGTSNALYSIVLYNTTPITMVPGQSLTYIQSPATWKLTFVGETLSSAGLDPVTLKTSSQGTGTYYQNVGTQSGTGTPTVTNITEPLNLLTVASTLPNAFTFAGQQGSSLQYDLTPYQLNEQVNAIATAGAPVVSNVVFSYTNPNNGLWVNGNYPITVTVIGHSFLSGNTIPTTNNQTTSVTIQLLTAAGSNTVQLPVAFWDVRAIQINRGLPGAISVAVQTYNSANALQTATLATLSNTVIPYVIYQQANLPYQSLANGGTGNVLYNGGTTPTSFTLTPTAAGTGKPQQYFTYTMQEVAIPTNTAAIDSIAFGIFNATSGVLASPLFNLNYSASGLRNNATYTPTTYTNNPSITVNVKPGFRTERGSQVTSIGPSSVTVSFAKTVDQLQFAVGPANATAVSKNWALYGPYGVGQATNIPNVSIGAVSSNVSVTAGSNSVVITGINQIQAIPSVTSATQPVLLTNLSSTAPIAVLDSQAAASPSSPYILIGSGFVNSLSAQLQSQYGITFTPTSTPIMQAYGANRILVAGYYANQTTSAANNFIQQLYAQAST